ncbi:MAG: prepilin peptidase [Anaerolineaceae bacterium]|nr:prepilin peptidase [Anaerolineaceae bacterium]
MTPTILAIWLFLVGACVGSFLNVCIYRLPAGLSIVWPPSHCTRCLKRIAWYDNLPILSWFILRGRCRYCGARFSIQYALVELLMGLLAAGLYLAYFVFLVRGSGFGRWDIYLVHMALLAALVVSSMIDLKYKEIYTVVTNVGMVLALAAGAIFPALHGQSQLPDWFGGGWLDGLIRSAVGLAVGGGMIWLTAILGRLVFRREAMGFGDVLLMGLIGAVLGWEGAVLTFFLAPFFGLIYGIWNLALHKDRELPYGPFLSMAVVVVMLGQSKVIEHFRPGLESIWLALTGTGG